MTLFKQKNRRDIVFLAVNTLSLLAILAQILYPTAVLGAENKGIFAFLSKKTTETTLSATQEDRMFVPNTNYKAPDKTVDAVLTAYSSTIDQCDEDPFTAASGKKVYDGMVAANFLPFGTKIKIPELYGDKIFTVDDRMNARYGYGRVDVWLDAPRRKVNEFGVKRLKIEVYYPKNYLAKK